MILWSFFKFCKILYKFSVPKWLVQNWSDAKPSSWESFSLEMSHMAPIMANHALYWMDSSFWWKDISYASS